MKITYEPGDMVTIEDNMNAGDICATDVVLIKKVSSTKWQVEVVEDDELTGHRQGEKGIIDEKWFQPNYYR